MTNPTFDRDGYPTEETLDAIRSWPMTDLPGLFRFIADAWSYPWSWREITAGTFEISTCGWSGNEDLVRALEGNQMAWALCWRESRRGGHYIFKIPEVKP